MSANNRALGEKEIQRIIQADKARKQNDSAKKAIDWPGDYNTVLLAEAVKDRKQIVEFDSGLSFTIRYDDSRKVVFIRPVKEGLFAPCGYFEYDRLKGVIA